MKQISVLIVDDIQLMRDLLRTTLFQLGIENISEAGNAKSALSVCQNNSINLVFLDINMPDASGFNVMETLRGLDSSLFVVMVSAESSLANVRESIRLGAKGFIVKPYTSERIKDILVKCKGELLAKADNK
jgi:two-component system chemotaxis response regulator CheY